MSLNKKPKLPVLLKTFLWVFIVQLVLLNVSAAIYAYKFTHFYSGPLPKHESSNIFNKTWKLFVGPRIYKMPYIDEPTFSYQEILLKTSEGIAIDAFYSHQDSVNACVIFFHGITANKSVLFHEAARFKEWGYNVLLVDFRGHGKSGGNATSFGAAETDEVEKAIQFAKTRGNKKVILYGSSLGSVVIMKAAAEKKITPSAIIADMPFASLHDHLKARARILGFTSEPFAFFVTLWMGIERGSNGFDQKTFSYAEKIDCPVLLQWGEADPLVTKEETERIYNSLKSNKQLVVYPYAGHNSFIQADPVGWQKEVGAFIRNIN